MEQGRAKMASVSKVYVLDSPEGKSILSVGSSLKCKKSKARMLGVHLRFASALLVQVRISVSPHFNSERSESRKPRKGHGSN